MKTLLLSAAFAIAASTATYAQDGQFHLGAGYAALDADEVTFDTIVLRAGYDFTPYFGVEGDVGIGVGDEEFGVSGFVVETSLNYLLGAYAKAQFPLTEQFSVFGRIGYAYVEADGDVAGVTTSSFTDEEDGFAFGAGAEFAFSGPNAVRFDYTRYEFGEDNESDGFGVYYVRRF